jgi:hypothetical protein
VGKITDQVVAYQDGEVSFEDLCVFLADFPYKACPRFGIWQMWAGPHALDDTTQELHIATVQLPDDEFVALMTAIKSRWASERELRDADLGRGDGGQAAVE